MKALWVGTVSVPQKIEAPCFASGVKAKISVLSIRGFNKTDLDYGLGKAQMD